MTPKFFTANLCNFWGNSMGKVKLLALRWPWLLHKLSSSFSADDVRLMLEEGVKQGRVAAVECLVQHPNFRGWNDDCLIGFAEKIFHQHHFFNTNQPNLSACLNIVLPALKPAQKNELFSYAVQFQSAFFIQHTLPHCDDKTIQEAVSDLFRYADCSEKREALHVLAQEYDMCWIVGKAMVHNYMPTVSVFFPQCNPEKILTLVDTSSLSSEMYNLLFDTISHKQKDILNQVVGRSFSDIKRKM